MISKNTKAHDLFYVSMLVLYRDRNWVAICR